MHNFPYQKIFVVRLSSLGDILLTTPLIRSLKNTNPKLEIHFLLREEYQDVLINNPYLSKLITIKREEAAPKTKDILSQNKYDFVIDLQNNLRSRSLTNSLKCHKVRFKKLSLQKFVLVKFKINKLSEAPPIPERYASVIKDLKLDEEGLDLFTNKKPSEKLKGLNNLIGFCPGSRHYTKMWPKEYYIELGKILIDNGYNIVLFGGKNDKEICKVISSSLSKCTNFCNDNDILQTAADMKLCKIIICNDSGLMHTACAVKVPVIAIFGSTVKEFGFTPYRSKNLILENKSLTCRPCSHIGRSSCPKVHFKCMKEITPQLVYNSLINLLS
jgi:lipopolysaccharide heptosyltransferase II